MPYHSRLERALKKEAKYYLWDWSEIEEKGPRFENMIAAHLLKLCDFYHDTFGIRTRLWYLRDREKREVDFLVTWDGTPWFMAECKLKKTKSKALRYYGKRLNVQQKFLVVFDENDHFIAAAVGGASRRAGISSMRNCLGSCPGARCCACWCTSALTRFRMPFSMM